MTKIMSSARRFAMFAALICMVGVILAACGDSPTATTPPAAATSTTATAATSTTAPASSDVQEVQLTTKEWEIIPGNVTVNAGKVRFIVTNAGTMSHNLTILLNGDVIGATPTFSPGDSPKIVEVDLQPGTYDMICSLPGHAARGQQGTITVK